MATREEVLGQLTDRLIRIRRQELAWADVVSSVQPATDTEKQKIVQGVQDGDPGKVGKILLNLILRKVATDARAEAESMLNDDTLTLADLERLF